MRPPIGDRIARGLERIATVAERRAEAGDYGGGHADYDEFLDAVEEVGAAIRYCRELARWYLDGEGI
jgi:hypothetical protein